MTATLMNASYEPFAQAQKKRWVVPTQPLWNALPIVQLARISDPGNVEAGKGYDHVPTSPYYPRGGRSEIYWDLGGWSRGMTRPACKQFLAILQVCWHCLAGIEISS